MNVISEHPSDFNLGKSDFSNPYKLHQNENQTKVE